MPLSPGDILKHIASEETRKRSHMAAEQAALLAELRNVLNPESQTFNPVSRLGAQIMQEEGKQIQHWRTPLNVLGLTFGNKYLAEDSTPEERNMLKEAELSPVSARGQIAVGPEALQGKRKDVIPHELAHKALQASGIQTFGIEEQIIRQLMINDALNAKENMQFLSATTRIDDKNILSIINELTSSVMKQATEKLKTRKKGK